MCICGSFQAHTRGTARAWKTHPTARIVTACARGQLPSGVQGTQCELCEARAGGRLSRSFPYFLSRAALKTRLLPLLEQCCSHAHAQPCTSQIQMILIHALTCTPMPGDHWTASGACYHFQNPTGFLPSEATALSTWLSSPGSCIPVPSGCSAREAAVTNGNQF